MCNRPKTGAMRGMDDTAAGESATAFETAKLGYCLVTGGAGYLGRNLVYELIWRGHRVRILDKVELSFNHEGLDFVKGDLCNFEDVRKACEGIDTIFHTAAMYVFLGWAPRKLRDEIFAVNVGGPQNVVEAALDAGVKRLVHTSSNNVTFGGPIIDGDETLPYVAKPEDLYTETKILGEKTVLAANGRGALLTCAIRPGGIYGPGEQLMLARVVEECASGKLVATLGDGSAKSDNAYIENLVDAHIEAARHLVPSAPVCGEAYFISDGVPLNYFEFFRPFIEGMGFRMPTRKIPARFIYAVAAVWEWLHWAIRIPRPMLSRLEVRKMVVSHYNRIDKAKRDFGWEPSVSFEEAVDESLAYCRDLLASRESVDRPHWAWWTGVLSGMTLLGVLAFHPGAHEAWSASVTAWTPAWLLRGIFVWAVATHVRKGLEAVRMAERAGLRDTSLAWGWQTFALGFASLSLLKRRIERDGTGER